jgi:DNA-binding PadR family transcriptional regulator
MAGVGRLGYRVNRIPEKRAARDCASARMAGEAHRTVPRSSRRSLDASLPVPERAGDPAFPEAREGRGQAFFFFGFLVSFLRSIPFAIGLILLCRIIRQDPVREGRNRHRKPALRRVRATTGAGLTDGCVLPQYVVMRHVVEATPISEAVFFILASLASEPRHGYSLLKDIEALSEGRVRLSTGTLYGALRRLLENEWIERFETADTSREKQTYRLTSLGRRLLRQEAQRLKQLARIASSNLRLKEV